MAINIQTEHLLTLSQAAAYIPRRRQGKRCSVATCYRWAQRGLRGIRLETILVGGTRCTSLESLQKFFDQLSAAADGQAQMPPPAALTTTRQRQIEAAERRLAKRGV